MAKYSSSDLNKRIDELEIDEEQKVSLMEDITDSIVDESAEIEKLKADVEEKSRLVEEKSRLVEEKTRLYDELLGKYKSRFMDSVDGSYNDEEEIKEKEDEVIDIKELF